MGGEGELPSDPTVPLGERRRVDYRLDRFTVVSGTRINVHQVKEHRP